MRLDSGNSFPAPSWREPPPSRLPHTPGTSARLPSLVLAVLLALVLWTAPLAEPARWIGLALFAAIVWIVQARVARFHPHADFGPANRITLARAASACGLVALSLSPGLSETMLWCAFTLSVGLILLDGVDGWLARRSAMASRFGARFDMEVDALTILALSALALTAGQAGPWVLALGLMRYVFVLASLVWPALAAPLPPSFRRKAVCVAQLGILTLILAPTVTPPATGALAFLALIALTWSFLIDLRWLTR